MNSKPCTAKSQIVVFFAGLFFFCNLIDFPIENLHTNPPAMQKNIDKEIADQLKDWNPMRDAYNDAKFNKYMSGPGADLEDNFQPSEMAKQTLQQRRGANDPYLMFTNVPDSLTLNGLLNICSGFGKTTRGNKRDGTRTYFVNFASINDMERVFTGLQDNTYGFKVFLGNKVNKDSKPAPPLPDLPSFPSNQIDYERSYQTSTRNPPRPHFNKQPFVSQTDYDNPDNLLSLVDPQRHFLIEDDAHDLERLAYSKQMPVEDGKYNYSTGRAYYVMSQKDKQFIEDKRKTTVGSYDADSEKFVKGSPVYDQVKVGPCECCGKTCDIICSRCSAFFCSTECQTNEWQKHRYVCGKPPGLVPLQVIDQTIHQALSGKQSRVDEETIQSQESSLKPSHHDSTQQAALKAQLPKSGDQVILTAISKTSVVFVRSKAFDDNMNFFNTVSIIQREAKYQRPIQHTPQRGDIVLTKFRENQYNRAMILNPDDLDHIKLIYIDYGNIDSKSLEELLDAPDKFWHLPRMAMPIILKDVPDFFMTDEVKKYMYTHLNTDMKIVYKDDDTENGVHRAELFDLNSNESYNKTIASLKSPTVESEKSPVLYREYLENLSLPAGENIKLIVMDNSLLQTAFVSCTTEAYALAIQKFQEEIQKYVADNPTNSAYAPRVNELCLVKYDEDNLWYRGRCIELIGDGHPSILFFDYGNISIVSVENIRRYPEEFTFPIMVGDCEIHGLPAEITDELKEKLENVLQPGTQLTCDRVEKFADDNFYVIHLGDLIKKVLC